MPEGPEVAREADRIRQAIGNEPVDAVRFEFPHLARRAASFVGARVLSVSPRGKAMLIRFDNELTIYSHNQLYGRWFVRKAGSLPRTNRRLRLAIETASRWALLYSASEIEILDEVGLSSHPYLTRLGPDALAPGLEVAEIAELFVDRRFARRGLGALLLDQSFVAGLGNYLRSEICFDARIHPDQRPQDLEPADHRRLARAILKLTRRAYESRGVTLPKTRAAALQRGGSSWGRARHWVFAREGEGCRRCEATIERFDLAGRRVYVCPGCQPRA
jgi:endonuclease-8